MKKQPHLDLIAFGRPNISDLNESQQKHFYITLLTRIHELKKSKQNERR